MVDITTKCPLFTFDASQGPLFKNNAIDRFDGLLHSECATLLFFGQVIFPSEVEKIKSWDRVHRLNELLKRLDACHTSESVASEVQALLGAWSLVYFRSDLKEIFLGRDVFGRKSLLWSRCNGSLVIAPFVVDFKLSWSELPSGCISVLKADDSIWSSTKAFSAQKRYECPWWQQFSTLDFRHLEEAYRRLLITNREPASEETVSDSVEQLLTRFSWAVRRCLSDSEALESVGILFSGGVDSLLVAIMAHYCVPPDCTIDLINVSFDNSTSDFSGAPDRSRGIAAYEHLKTSYPQRQFRLLLANVSKDELSRCRTERIAAVVAPADSVLDDSIGCVQWFAARAEGIVYNSEPEQHNQSSSASQSAKSQAKLILVGTGADELFGGYSRHRGCFVKGGRNLALAELELELSRIGERNLSRDDRVVSSLGKDARAPFLDDVFVEWVNSLPLEIKADFSMKRGMGEKRLIREALKVLGVPEALYSAPKRAMQFGTRIAKLENRKEKGSDVCKRLLFSSAA